MKIFKLSKPILFVLALSILIISCENKEELQQDDKEAFAKMKTHIIPLKDAVKMYDKYSKERVHILKDTLKKKYGNDFTDTRTVWFDLNTIKQYIKYIEDNSADAEGLQFYFSVDLDVNGKQKNHQTFFIAPTVKNIIGKDTIQSGYTIKDGNRIFLYEAFKDYLNSSESTLQKASFINLMQGDKDGLLFNEGTGSPPNGYN